MLFRSVQLASELYAGRPKMANKKGAKGKLSSSEGDAFADFDIPGLILQSPMVSLGTLYAPPRYRHYFLLFIFYFSESTKQGAEPKTPRGNAKDAFVNAKKLSVIECPVLIAHGDADSVISVKHSRRLCKHVTNLWQYVELAGVDHFDVDDDNEYPT